MKVVIEIGRFFCNIFFSTLVRVKVTGLENIPADGPLIIASNHVTAADVIFLEYKLKHRHICWMAKAELFKKRP